MLETIETRWFGPGEAPADISTWFETLPGQPEAHPPRRDFYLQPVADSGLSVKLREGGLEIKQRQETLGHFQFSQSAAGLVERWAKWRFPLDQPLQPVQSVPSGHDSWAAVTKKRQLKHYYLNQDGAVQPLLASETVAEGSSMGCHLELATIWIGGRGWWTVAYEAGFRGEQTLGALLTIVGAQLAEDAPGQLFESSSYGYPRWLATCREFTLSQSTKER